MSDPYPKWLRVKGTKSWEQHLFIDNHRYFDHFQRRKTKDGQPYFISQPYFIGGLNFATLKHMIFECEKQGVEFDIMPNSDHFPGKTILFRWRQANETKS